MIQEEGMEKREIIVIDTGVEESIGPLLICCNGAYSFYR